ncbi:PQQ-binding-like beta-propeller repeat protein [Roseivirga sp. BDSF3-8]|uniref:outer membrane protein assembly factor BamB family protein n=1 Tax=Roseivirga sp. BDSF3-8 TaxID=3241598 RepID=UPI003531CF76
MMYKYSESVRNQFKNYHQKGSQLLTVFLDASGNTVISGYDADKFKKEHEINLGCKTFNIFFYPDEYILAYFPLQRLVKVRLETGESSTTEGLKFAPEILVNNNLLGISVDGSSNKKLARLDLETNELSSLFEEPFRLWGSNGHDVYGVKIGRGQELYSINPLTGSINWQNDFGADLFGKVISYEEMILVVGKSNFFGINAKNGTNLWERSSTNHLLQLYKDKIINVDASYYREISPDTGETLVEYEMKPEYEKHGFRFMGTNRNFTITDTHIFIVDAMGFKMGCINCSTGKIDWSVEVGEGKVTLPHAPIVYRNKLYVLDNEGTLHVYDRE